MLTLYERKTEGHLYHEVEECSLTQWRQILAGLHAAGLVILAETMPVRKCLFSVRAENVLTRSQITTLGQLSAWPKQFPGAGRKTLEEFRAALAFHHLPYPGAVSAAQKKE